MLLHTTSWLALTLIIQNLDSSFRLHKKVLWDFSGYIYQISEEFCYSSILFHISLPVWKFVTMEVTRTKYLRWSKVSAGFISGQWNISIKIHVGPWWVNLCGRHSVGVKERLWYVIARSIRQQIPLWLHCTMQHVQGAAHGIWVLHKQENSLLL